MTVIDKISFRFSMQDERFARNLYADWDEFCRKSVTGILDEFFLCYDTKDTYIEIDGLELDLGSIPQEEFHDLFPVRLREALERVFMQKLNEKGISPLARPEADAGTGSMRDKSALHVREKRFDNLLHYLEYGFCLPQWESGGFDLYEELLHFRDTEHMERLLALALSKPHVMERLFLQTDAARLTEAIPFAAWLGTTALGRYEKQRFLSAVLELAPYALIRFIHEAKDSGSVENMAELLENPHIRRIMETETESHAEIDVPEYWYRLYGWLLEYYPFNGVPMFGDKHHFRLHLGRRLLSFIRKREQQAYLSKADLTLRFLLEVFGADYYLTVLDIIYRNQRLNADGSPATGDSYAWELYYMLLQLSLLGMERDAAGNTGVQPSDEKTVKTSPYADASLAMSVQTDSFGKWLENTEHSVQAKRMSLLRLLQDKPELIVKWLKNRPDHKYLGLLASLADKPILLLLAGHVSLQLAETLSILPDVLEKASASVSWLRDAGRDRLTEALNAAVLWGISAGAFSASESVSVQVSRIAGLLYEEITGKKVPIAADASPEYAETVGASEPASAESIAVPKPLRELLESLAAGIPVLSAGNDTQGTPYREHHLNKKMTMIGNIASLKTVLSDSGIPERAKRIFVLQWFDACRGREKELVSALLSENLSEAVIGLLDKGALRNIAVRLAGQAHGSGRAAVGTDAVRFVGLLAEHMEAVAGLVSRPVKGIWHPLLVSLASWNDSSGSIAANGGMETVVRLLSAIAEDDTDKIRAVVESLTGVLHLPYIGVSDNESRRGLYEEKLFPLMDNTLFALLVQVRQHIGLYPAGESLDLNEVRTAFERHLNDTAGLTGWLRNETFFPVQKREVFRRYMADSPTEAAWLLRETIASDEGTVGLWTEIIGKDAILYLLGQTDPTLAGVLAKAISAINSESAGKTVFTGGSAEQDDSVAKAILLLMAETPDAGTMSAEEIVSLFLHRLHEAIAGNKEYTDADRGQWEAMERQVVGAVVSGIPMADAESVTATGSETVAPSLEGPTAEPDGKLFDEWAAWLLSPSASDTEKSRMLRHYARWKPELLWKFVRYSTAGDSRRSNIPSDRWNTWLGTSDWLEMLSGVSLSLGETLRRTVGAVSGRYGISDTILSEGLVRFISVHPADRIYHGNTSAVVREYLGIASALAWKDGIPDAIREQLATVTGDDKPEQGEKEKTSQPDERETALETVTMVVEAELHITDTEQAIEDAVQPEYMEVPNAGLCLLALWLPRLFDMLGLLADDKKALKDTEARIRAIFILQRIVTEEVREYKEQELAFNRILTACPFHVPLPKTLELTENEIRTVASMLDGVKANWSKMANTSVKGFQRSFIERPGRLEQREEKWVLYVDNRAYDILLDSIPWSYRQIRLPWLKKKINVVWRDKEEFDFENL